MVLEIWNERVSAVCQVFKFVRTVVLVKSKDYTEYLVFEFDTIRYDPELYDFFWNKRGNLEGHEKSTKKHKFTWQPGGSQFTILEDIPKERLHISVKKPEPIDRDTLLKTISFDKSWYHVVSTQIPEKTGIIRRRDRMNAYAEMVSGGDE